MHRVTPIIYYKGLITIGPGQITGVIAAVLIIAILLGLYYFTQKPQLKPVKRKLKNTKTEQEVWYERKKDFIPSQYHKPIQILLQLSKHAQLRQKVLNMALVAEGFENKFTKGKDNPFESLLELMQRRTDLNIEEAYDTTSFESLEKPYVVELLILKKEAFLIGKHNDDVYTVKDLKGNVFNVSKEEFQLPARFKGRQPSKTSNFIALKEQKLKRKGSDKQLTLLGWTVDDKLIVKTTQNHREMYELTELTTRSGKKPPISPILDTDKYYTRLTDALRNRSLISEEVEEDIKAILKDNS